jgi:hypothetical protein
LTETDPSLSSTDLKYMEDCDVNKNWPYGRAVFINKDKTFKMKINYVDHVEIKSEVNRTVENPCDIFKAY